MRNITNELVDVAEWESVGIALGVSSTKLHEIRANRMNNGPLCKISMADTWLRSDVNASWEKLADALKETGNDTQAEQVYQAVSYTHLEPTRRYAISYAVFCLK